MPAPLSPVPDPHADVAVDNSGKIAEVPATVSDRRKARVDTDHGCFEWRHGRSGQARSPLLIPFVLPGLFAAVRDAGVMTAGAGLEQPEIAGFDAGTRRTNADRRQAETQQLTHRGGAAWHPLLEA